MELANHWHEGLHEGMDTAVIRTATANDASDIYQLLRRATNCHVHVGWHLPVHWLGRDEFLVYEPPPCKNKFLGDGVALRACLVATANPSPVAWVHVAAIRGVAEPVSVLAAMLEQLEKVLRQTAVTRLAWMPTDNWLDEWVQQLGFTEINHLHTYWKHDFIVPEVPSIAGLTIRPAVNKDLPQLVQIEEDAFTPLWRHSLDDLSMALSQAFSFDVAELDNRVVGFQLSTGEKTLAHLARLTISPFVQKRGLGSALLSHAIQGYQKRGLRSVSLNTQADNIASHQLYKKFGFVKKRRSFSIWAKQVSSGIIK